MGVTNVATKRRPRSTLKLREIGNSVGVVLPKDLLDALGVKAGDEIDDTIKQRGKLELSAPDEEVGKLMEMAEEIMDRRRDLRRALAK